MNDEKLNNEDQVKPESGRTDDSPPSGAESDRENVFDMGDVRRYTDEDNKDIPITGPEQRQIPESPIRRFFGEVVSKRHPVLIALVMIFALFLAAGPLLFRYQKSAMTDALVIYTQICERNRTGRITDDWMKSVSGPELQSMSSTDRAAFFTRVECLPEEKYHSALRPVKGMQFGPKRAYVLSLHQSENIRQAEKEGLKIINIYFTVINDVLKIDLMPLPSSKGE